MSSLRNAPSVRCWRLPRALRPWFLGFYRLHYLAAGLLRWIYRVFYAGPLFRGRCDAVGSRFSLMKIPDAGGHSRLVLGNDVEFRGHFGVGSGRVFDNPELLIGSRCDIAPDLVVTVNQRIQVDDDVKIGAACRFMDTDSHPREAIARAANAPPGRDEIKPVHICAHARIGGGSFILKGVTLGEGVSVGVNSVVVASVPPYTAVAGNPARIIARNIGQKNQNLPEQA